MDLIVTASFPYINTSLDSLDDYTMMERYLRGYVAIFTLAKKHLNKAGLLVNLLGQSADFWLPSAPHYGASFAYIDNLAKSLQRPLRPSGADERVQPAPGPGGNRPLGRGERRRAQVFRGSGAGVYRSHRGSRASSTTLPE